MKRIGAHYFSRRFFFCVAGAVMLFVLGHFYPSLVMPAKIVLFTLIAIVVLDAGIIHRVAGIEANREMPDRLSNGDDNKIELCVENLYGFPISAEIIDELPFALQMRDFSIKTAIPAGGRKVLSYVIRPVRRGEYNFGSLNIYASSPIGLAVRRYRFSADMMVPVYPSIIQMKKYEFFAVSNRLTETGIKKIRRIGVSMEFDQIRRYVTGDDYRKINWKATARKNEIMVNQYRDERSQHVYSIIDMGRAMKMPFNGMTLLDYAVNAALVISNVAIRREDKAGVITFTDKIEAVLPANREQVQIFRILNLLYRCKTDFMEPGYELLCAEISRSISHRSLLLLFTNFETMDAIRRNLAYLSIIARRHVLVVIFFLNTEIEEFRNEPAGSIEDIYIKTIAEKFSYEKKQIVKELDRHGIQSILTSPENLTVDAINKYLELKSRGLL